MVPVVEIGPLTFSTHDIFTLLGLAAGFALYYRALRRDRILGPQIVDHQPGRPRRRGDRRSAPDELGGHRRGPGGESADHLVVTHGPRSIIGGLVGGYAAIVLSKRALGYTLSTGDYYAAAIPLALLIGRFGCFLSELPLGTPTDLPWGMTVSPEAAAAFPRCPGCGGPMHPSMLYEIGFLAVAFGIIATRGPILPFGVTR